MAFAKVLESFRAGFAQDRTSEQPADTVHHRRCGPEEVKRVESTGEVWGAAPRHIHRSDLPCVKAFVGPLPPGARGYEFTTAAKPTYSSPYERRWLEGSLGVWVEDGYAKIRVKLLRSSVE
jgi:hypothetical protein